MCPSQLHSARAGTCFIESRRPGPETPLPPPPPPPPRPSLLRCNTTDCSLRQHALFCIGVA